MNNIIEAEAILPSKGKFYNDIDEKIVFRSLTTADEQKIFGSSSNATLDRVLDDCLIEPKVSVNKFIPADKQFYMLKLRIHTYGSEYKQMMYCPLCDTESEVKYNLDDVEVFEMDDSIPVPLKIRLPISKDVLVLNVLNCEQLENIKNQAAKRAKSTGAAIGEVQFFLRLKGRIATVNDEELDSFRLDTYIRELHPKDRAYIDSAFKSIKVGYSSVVNVVCPKCKKEITIPFEVTGEFFNPTTEITFL